MDAAVRVGGVIVAIMAIFSYNLIPPGTIPLNTTVVDVGKEHIDLTNDLQDPLVPPLSSIEERLREENYFPNQGAPFVPITPDDFPSTLQQPVTEKPAEQPIQTENDVSSLPITPESQELELNTHTDVVASETPPSETIKPSDLSDLDELMKKYNVKSFDESAYFKQKQQKFALQTLALFATIAAVMYSTRFVVLKKRPQVNLPYSVMTLIVFVVLIAWAINSCFPESFQATHPQVAFQHAQCRKGCSVALAQGDVQTAANYLMSSVLGKEIAEKTVYGRNIISTQAVIGANWMLTNMGTTLAVLPFLVWLFIAVVMRLKTGTLGSTFPLAIQAAVIPITVNIVACCSVIFAFFLFYVDSTKFSNCIWISGHWYTATATLFLMCILLVHLMQSLGLKSLVTLAYFVYVVVYVIAIIAVLRNTQEYYHDSFEATEALRHTVFVLLLVFVLFSMIEFISRSKAKMEMEQVAATEEKIKKLDPRVKEVLKNAGISVADLFSGDNVQILLDTLETVLPIPQQESTTKADQKDPVVGSQSDVTKFPSVESSHEKTQEPNSSKDEIPDIPPPPPEAELDIDMPPPPDGMPEALPHVRAPPVKKTWNLSPPKSKSTKPTSRPNAIASVDLISSLQTAITSRNLKPANMRLQRGDLPIKKEKTLEEILKEKMAQRRVFLEVELNQKKTETQKEDEEWN